MNYMLLYKKILNNAKNRGTGEEKHHIIPKSLVGNLIIVKMFNDVDIFDDVTIKLSLREHFIVHKILVKLCEFNTDGYIKMLYAFHFLNSRIGNSKIYSKYKNDFIEYLSSTLKGKPSRAKGIKWSIESRYNKSKNHYMKGKTYEQIYGEDLALKLKDDRRISLSNRIVSDSTKQKLSKRIFTKEHREKISKSQKGKKISDDHKNKISKFMSNREKNPRIDRVIYRFYHKDGRIIDAIKYDMKKIYNCTDIHRIINGSRSTSKGWSYKGEIITGEYYDL